MKILNAVLMVIFLLFAAVQFNDPDPVQWITLYGYVALVCGMAIFDKYNRWVIISGIAVCILGAILYFPGLMELFQEHEVGDLTRQMKADQPYIEEARESLGLLIAAMVLGFQYFRMKKFNNANKN